MNVSCVVGMYRLKGAKFVTYLVPETPKPSAGDFVSNVTEKTVEIMWEPPKKDFSNYTLTIEQDGGYVFIHIFRHNRDLRVV